MILALARLLLRLERRRLELVTFGPFDARRSRRLDAVVAALEALR
ncbi:MAG TPA: hypothetical protein VE932_05015 [Patescibacteria group bacterium]|nr:hypothetical protein [Patescibacteria group bacterium]